jgi:uncharacterized damage-inducible protein DinB
MTKRELVEYLDNRVRKCWYLLDKVPEDRWNWRPAEGLMTLGELANHVATLLDIESAMFAGGLTKESYAARVQAMRKDNKQALVTMARECHARAMKFFSTMSEEDFETDAFTTPAGTTMSFKGGVLAELEHFTHHRSQLWVYLNQLGVKIDPCDLWN